MPALTIKSALLSFVGTAARQLARAHVSPNLPSLCGRYIRELRASGKALKPSLRVPIILIVGCDGGRGRARTRSLGVLLLRLDLSSSAEGEFTESPRRRTCLRHPNTLFPPTTPANSSAGNWFHMWKILHVFYCLPVWLA